MFSEPREKVRHGGNTYLADRVEGLVVLTRKHQVPWWSTLVVLVTRRPRLTFLSVVGVALWVLSHILGTTTLGLLALSLSIFSGGAFLLSSIGPWRRVRSGGRSFGQWSRVMDLHRTYLPDYRPVALLFGPDVRKTKPANVRSMDREARLQGGLYEGYVHRSRDVVTGLRHTPSLRDVLARMFTAVQLLNDDAENPKALHVVLGSAEFIFDGRAATLATKDLCTLIPDATKIKDTREALDEINRSYRDAAGAGAETNWPEMAQAREDREALSESLRVLQESVDDRLTEMFVAQRDSTLLAAENLRTDRRENALKALQDFSARHSRGE